MSNQPTARLVNLESQLHDLCIGMCDKPEGAESAYFKKKTHVNGTITWFPYIPFYIQGSGLCDRTHPIGALRASSLEGHMEVVFFISDETVTDIIERFQNGEAEIDQYNAVKFMLYHRLDDVLTYVACLLAATSQNDRVIDLWKLSGDMLSVSDVYNMGLSILSEEKERLEKLTADTSKHNNYIINVCQDVKKSGMFAGCANNLSDYCHNGLGIEGGEISLPDEAPDDWGEPAGDYVSRSVYTAKKDDYDISISFYAGAKKGDSSKHSLDFAVGWEGVIRKLVTENEEDGKVIKMHHDIGNIADVCVYSQDFSEEEHKPIEDILTENNVYSKLSGYVDEAADFIKGVVSDHNPLPNTKANATIFKCS